MFDARGGRLVNIEELAGGLPNGFHDALLRSMSVDTVSQTAAFALDVWIGDLDARTSAERERRRAACISLTGLSHFSIDPPGPGASQSAAGPLMVDLCDADASVPARSTIDDGGFAARFFVSQWNAFIHFAARDATLTWTEPE